ncbi:MAG: DMT family transporter [Anaeromicrobium sp.]|jgi:drug/metabolite transporter (DMT)-like permease|uniref:DMT family transporter n=1 Tax=Anaeromicrobium sp. TaxID=1929132 RepID=UPI0025DA86BF|nr:DMT family transporter [Anaeromicrobium sp.]MCT4595932.1 DMT family transporter [Anaeromicrobium sp.]
MSKKNILPYFCAIIVFSIWGLSFIFTKQAIVSVDVYHFLGLRFGTAALVLLVLKLLNIIKLNYTKEDLYKLLILSTVQPLAYFILEINALKVNTTSEVGIMMSLIPVFVAILAPIFLDEKPSRSQFAFILISVSGVIFMIVMKGLTLQINLYGMLILLLAVISGSFYNILARKFSSHCTPVEITFVMMWLGAIVFNGISIYKHISLGNLNEYFLPLQDIHILVSVLYLGILASIVAFFLFNYNLSKLSASNVAVFTNFTTVVSILAGVFIYKEPFYWYQVLGTILILIGVAGTNYFGAKGQLKIEEER